MLYNHGILQAVNEPCMFAMFFHGLHLMHLSETIEHFTDNFLIAIDDTHHYCFIAQAE